MTLIDVFREVASDMDMPPHEVEMRVKMMTALFDKMGRNPNAQLTDAEAARLKDRTRCFVQQILAAVQRGQQRN